MARPLKPVRWRWIGKSLALYENGVFVGSVGQADLVEFVKVGVSKRKAPVINKKRFQGLKDPETYA